MNNEKITVTRYTTTSALGRGITSALDSLQSGKTGLTPCDFADVNLDTWIGRVKGLSDDPITGDLSRFDCRNNRLAKVALQQDGFTEAVSEATVKYGANRIAVIMGTSTSGIRQTEIAYADFYQNKRDAGAAALPADFYYETTHSPYSVAAFTQQYLGLSGPSIVISTACSSSAKVFASAYRLMANNFCDAAIVGGVDSLCLTTLLGFNSLELVSNDLCRPWDENRKGINIGEAGGFALLEKNSDAKSIRLLGYGETSDAYHMSTPHPQGRGAALAMRQALDMAKKKSLDIGYVNLHGTATPSNDSAEDAALMDVFDYPVIASSTKGWTGHTLGAAGITESIFCFLALEHGFIPQSLNTTTLDTALSANIALETQSKELNVVMSNSLGFGGSNCSLVFGKL